MEDAADLLRGGGRRHGGYHSGATGPNQATRPSGGLVLRGLAATHGHDAGAEQEEPGEVPGRSGVLHGEDEGREAWRESKEWNDLWHVPGLVFEGKAWRNDPFSARRAILNLLAEMEELTRQAMRVTGIVTDQVWQV